MIMVPSVVYLTASIGRPKHVRVMAGGLEGDMFIGPKAEEHRGLLNIRYPIEVGCCGTSSMLRLTLYPGWRK